MAIDMADIRSSLDTAGSPWQARENYLTEMVSEQRTRLLGAMPSVSAVSLAAAPPMAVQANHPPALDWRNNNGNHVTPVQSQGGCGACVSFSCCGVVESMAHIEHGVWLDLSEADSHFCSSHGSNCQGWWPDHCLSEIQGRGVVEEHDFPYNSAFPNNDPWQSPPICAAVTNRPAKATRCAGPIALTGQNAIKNHLANVGPVAGCFDVYDDFFTYASGVYRHVSGAYAGGHCVLVIGYSNAEQCWIAKNSWDISWGMAGFFKIDFSAMVLNGEPYPMYGTRSITLPSGGVLGGV